MKKFCFVSTPYASIKASGENERVSVAINLAHTAANRVSALGYVPISPVLLWCDVYDEQDRKEIMEACFKLLKSCEAYYFFQCEFSDKSEGMQAEREYALKLKKEILD